MTTHTNATPGNPRAMVLRVAGIAIACSAPISGILSYAIAAVLLGEDRLEGPTGLTALGWTAMALGWTAMAVPVVVGLTVFGLSFFRLPVPSQRSLGLAAGVLSATFLWFGSLSLLAAESGDVSIGGALLIVAGVPLLVAALYLSKPARK